MLYLKIRLGKKALFEKEGGSIAIAIETGDSKGKSVIDSNITSEFAAANPPSRLSACHLLFQRRL
jgi:hypothetical protein